MHNHKHNLDGRAWRISGVVAGVALLFSLLWFRLGSITYGNAAAVEVATRRSAGDWQTILANPLNAPYKAAQLLVYITGHHGITSLRLISTVFAVLAAVFFYHVARQWHNQRVALLATWLFISSSWYLHVARLGSAGILWILCILAIVVMLTPNKNGRHNRLALPSTLFVLGAVLYVPGMIWLVLAGVMLQRKNIKEAWAASRALPLRIASVVIGLAVVAPLATGLAQHPAHIKRWLGLASNIGPNTESAKIIIKNLIGVPKSLFLQSSYDSVHWLGHLPLLSSFEIIMFLLGVYFYATHIRAARTRMIVVLAGIACLIVGVNGLLAISLVVPVVYLLIASGIAYILHLWLKVFPNNPVARSLGFSIIMFAVLLTSVYQTRSYFVAWRYNPDTVQAFQTKL